MKIFLDTANIEQIREANDWGVLDGVTTNPSLVAKENKKFEELVPQIMKICKGPVSLEVISTNADGMVAEAEKLVDYGPNVVIKVPMIPEGLKAIRRLAKKEIATNCTLVFNATQALLAAKAGATYVSPFIGRLDDAGHFGMELVQQIVMIFDNYAFGAEVLAASLRHPLHVVEAALAGADVATIPWSVLQKIVKHPLTDRGLEQFLKDWARVPK
ncbi:MAG: fructose-6-phosphate aldolase [Gammaproteobacteria bacterium]|nr:fructose-6-phosphate aldolase [Gammaproteobacteria bacterium]